MKGVLCAFACSLFTVFSQVLWKIGLAGTKMHLNFDLILFLIGNWRIWCGLVGYGVATLIWFYALSKFELSYIYPLMGITYILSLAAGAFIFNEAVGWNKIAGVLFIILGIVLVARS